MCSVFFQVLSVYFLNMCVKSYSLITRWFKYDRDKLWLVYTQSVPVIFEPPFILRKFLNAFAKLRKVNISFVMCVHLSPTERIFTKFDIWVFFLDLSRKFKLHQNLTKNNGYLRWVRVCIYGNVLLNSSHNKKAFKQKTVGKIKTQVLCSKNLFQNSCRLWDDVKKYGTARQATDYNIIQRMRFACWIPKATNKHSEYVILTAFTRQQWLHESATLLPL